MSEPSGSRRQPWAKSPHRVLFIIDEEAKREACGSNRCKSRALHAGYPPRFDADPHRAILPLLPHADLDWPTPSARGRGLFGACACRYHFRKPFVCGLAWLGSILIRRVYLFLGCAPFAFAVESQNSKEIRLVPSACLAVPPIGLK
ncbi:hypothetical protein BaRGS_00003383 [Batillaria attramentaria]|uniref:Uncharacterized protein n=1 Tax=Batillaria attramentaria TaxID=370345 RepID=A0ABD0M153_9CAEN